MAIFVTGDVHGGAEYGSSRFSSKSWPDGSELPGDWEYDRKGGYVYCSFS